VSAITTTQQGSGDLGEGGSPWQGRRSHGSCAPATRSRIRCDHGALARNRRQGPVSDVDPLDLDPPRAMLSAAIVGEEHYTWRASAAGACQRYRLRYSSRPRPERPGRQRPDRRVRARRSKRFRRRQVHVEEWFTGSQGKLSTSTHHQGFKGLVEDGKYDHLPEAAF